MTTNPIPLSTLRTWRMAAALTLAAALAACGGSGGGTDTPAPPAVATPAPPAQVAAGTWVVMGSSTAAGAGAPDGKGWVALMAANYAARGAQVANIAKGGTVTYEGLSATAAPVPGRPPPDLGANIDQALSRRPVLLIVSYPTNDTSRGFSADETVNNLLAIRAQALAAGVPVLLLSTQPRNLPAAQRELLPAIDARLAQHVGSCLVNVRAQLAAPDGLLASAFDSGDGVHPNAAGHEKIAAEVIRQVDAGTCIRLAPPP